LDHYCSYFYVSACYLFSNSSSNPNPNSCTGSLNSYPSAASAPGLAGSADLASGLGGSGAGAGAGAGS